MPGDAADWSPPATAADMLAVQQQLNQLLLNTQPLNNPLVTSSVNVGVVRGVMYAAAGRWVVIAYNPSVTATIWVGDNTIAAGQGTPILPGDIHVWSINGITLYAISDSGTVAVTLNLANLT